VPKATELFLNVVSIVMLLKNELHTITYIILMAYIILSQNMILFTPPLSFIHSGVGVHKVNALYIGRGVYQVLLISLPCYFFTQNAVTSQVLILIASGTDHERDCESI
jgi:hypothetical protein